MNHQQLLLKAQQARKNAYSPCSHFNVGAALKTRSGKVYTGCNVELPTVLFTICGERVALVKALSDGEREFDTMVIASSSGELTPPCGFCRQMMWELMPDAQVVIGNDAGEIKVYQMSELLPFAFNKDFIK